MVKCLTLQSTGSKQTATVSRKIFDKSIFSLKVILIKIFEFEPIDTRLNYSVSVHDINTYHKIFRDFSSGILIISSNYCGM